MKILHILYSGLGGHGNVFFSMFRADHERLFTLEALFNGVEELRDEYKDRCIENGIKWCFLKKKPGLDIAFYRKLVSTIRKSDPQIIFLHTSAHIIPAKIAAMLSRGKKKIIVRETQANELKTRKEWMGLKLSMLLASKVVFLSEAYRQQVKKRLYWSYRKKKAMVVPNGIDLDIFTPAEKKPSSFILLGMQSRVVAIKDHRSLLHAFALMKEQYPQLSVKLKIAGDGEHRTVLEQLTLQLNIENDVEFTGVLNEVELVVFLQSLDIYIHASLGETMSTAIMQAMACKKTIIASDVAGINNMLLQNETGLLVPTKDPAALAAGILRLINEKELAARLAKNGYQFALDNYSNTAMFNRYKILFNS